MPIEARPGQPPGFIPIENVGVRGSARRAGERRLTVLRPTETEQPKTLLQEMQQYITTRQSLRDNGYFFLMGRELANINLADATHNDLFAIGFDESLRDWQSVLTKGNHVRVQNVFDAYAMGEYSPEKQREVLRGWEEVQRLSRQSRKRILFAELTPTETETVQWLLARIGIQFDAPPEGFKESYSTLLLRMRSATAEHQQLWEQERKPQERVYQLTRRR